MDKKNIVFGSQPDEKRATVYHKWKYKLDRDL